MLFSRNDEQLQDLDLVSEMLKLKAGGTEFANRHRSIWVEARLTKYTVTSKLCHSVTKPKTFCRLFEFNYRNARAYISQTVKNIEKQITNL